MMLDRLTGLLLPAIPRQAIVAMLLVAVSGVCATQFGCGSGGPKKTEDPAEIEKMRQEHQDMSQREFSNEG